MGVTCCKDLYDHSLLMDVGDMANLYDFEVDEWPNDKYLSKLLQQSSVAEGDPKEKPFKHRFYERYYWGGWANGKPKGKGIFYTKDSLKKVYYEGEVDGEPNGKGKVVFNDGEWEYEGCVNNGQAHGIGKMINRKDGYTFEGDWRDSKPYKGKLILKCKSKQTNKETNSNFMLDSKENSEETNMFLLESGKQSNKSAKQLKEKQNSQHDGDIQINLNLDNHETEILYPDGRIYKGAIDHKRFVPHGIGKVVRPDKSEYIGEWHQGEMHGIGKSQWSDNSCYHGDYMFGKRHGNGKFVFNNGKYYDGRWSDGKQNGQGTLYSKEGQVLKKGLWKNGEFFGAGH